MILSSGCSTDVDINEYSEKLQFNFPEGMNLVYYDVQSELQDYRVHSIYKVPFNQKNALLTEIMKNICDSNGEKNEHYSCWHRCGDYFSFKYNNKIEGILIEVTFIAKNNMSLLNIYEIKI